MTPRKRIRVTALVVCSLIGATLSIPGCGGGGGSVSGTSRNSGPGVSTISSQPLVCSSNAYLPNYSGETDPLSGLPNKLYHWNKTVLNVYFAPSALSTSGRQAQAVQGFEVVGTNHLYWQLLQVVTDPSQADITVQFENSGQTGYGAITTYNATADNVLQNATITFNMTYLAAISNIVPVAAHEFGHAIGIGGHSRDAGDVMDANTSVYSDTQLDTRDINTIMTAYCGGANAGSQKTLPMPGGAAINGQIACPLGVN